MKENKDLNKNKTTGSPSRNVSTERSETRNDINETSRQETSGDSAGFGSLSETVGGRGAGSGSGLSPKTGRTGSDTDGQVS